MKQAYRKMILFTIMIEDLLPRYQADEGMPVALNYVVHGTNMNWSYQWYYNGQTVLLSNHEFSGANTTTLTIHRVAGQARYWCVAQSEDKTLKFRSATAVVIAKGILSSKNVVVQDGCLWCYIIQMIILCIFGYRPY